jgi:hypothetical protein
MHKKRKCLLSAAAIWRRFKVMALASYIKIMSLAQYTERHVNFVMTAATDRLLLA